MGQNVHRCNPAAGNYHFQFQRAAEGIHLGVIGAISVGPRFFLREEGAVKLLQSPLNSAEQSPGRDGGTGHGLDINTKGEGAVFVKSHKLRKELRPCGQFAKPWILPMLQDADVLNPMLGI